MPVSLYFGDTRHKCKKQEINIFNGICTFQMLMCLPSWENMVHETYGGLGAPVYFNMLFKCEYEWQVMPPLKIKAGGQIQIGLSVYNPTGNIRRHNYRAHSQWYNIPSDPMMCHGPPQIYLEGYVWFEVVFNILGYECSLRFDFKIRYEVISDEVSITMGRTGGCGPVGIGVDVTLKWSPAKVLVFPKAPPTGFEVAATGSFTIDECVRICLPMLECGWSGCRDWTKCHRGCVKVRFAAKLGPFALDVR